MNEPIQVSFFDGVEDTTWCCCECARTFTEKDAKITTKLYAELCPECYEMLRKQYGRSLVSK